MIADADVPRARPASVLILERSWFFGRPTLRGFLEAGRGKGCKETVARVTAEDCCTA
jgi:hypothetical protein